MVRYETGQLNKFSYFVCFFLLRKQNGKITASRRLAQTNPHQSCWQLEASIVLTARSGPTRNSTKKSRQADSYSAIHQSWKKHSRAWNLCSSACQAHPQSGHTGQSSETEGKQKIFVSHSVSSGKDTAIVLRIRKVKAVKVVRWGKHSLTEAIAAHTSKAK